MLTAVHSCTPEVLLDLTCSQSQLHCLCTKLTCVMVDLPLLRRLPTALGRRTQPSSLRAWHRQGRSQRTAWATTSPFPCCPARRTPCTTTSSSALPRCVPLLSELPALSVHTCCAATCSCCMRSAQISSPVVPHLLLSQAHCSSGQAILNCVLDHTSSCLSTLLIPTRPQTPHVPAGELSHFNVSCLADNFACCCRSQTHPSTRCARGW